MRTIEMARAAALAASLLALSVACGESGPGPGAGAEPEAAQHAEDAHDDHDDEPRTLVLDEAGRSQLGLVLEPVQLRPRGPSIELPGEIEPTYDARYVASSPLAGRIELIALPLESVQAGDLLFRVDAPVWRTIQADLVATEAEIEGHDAWLREAQVLKRAHERHEEALAALEDRWRDRLAELDSIRAAAGGQAAALVDAQAALFDARARLSEAQEVGARLAVDRAERTAARTTARARLEALYGRASTLTGHDLEALAETSDDVPRWKRIDRIEIRARRGGLIETLHANDGAWVDPGAAVLDLRRVDALWVHADAWQADLPRLEEGAAVRVRPAAGPQGDDRFALARLAPGLAADPRQRSADAIVRFEGAPPSWARPGLAVRVEVLPDPSLEAGLAVPHFAVRRDGLHRVVWAEDPSMPSRLVCVDVEVLDEVGDWTWVRGPIEPGCRVVTRGAGRLSVTVEAAEGPDGHYHADGSFHPEDH